MRALIIAIPLGILMWWGIFALIAEYGFDAFAFVLMIAGFAYIATTIKRDWKSIASDEWRDGETTNYGRTE